MKKVQFFAAVLLMALGVASCQKEEKTTILFTAKMEQAYQQDKTVLDTSSNLLSWVSGDQVRFTSGSGTFIFSTMSSATPHADDPTWADFQPQVTGSGDGSYRVVYPFSSSHFKNRTLTLDLPAVQSTVAGELTGFPMYAYSQTSTLQFRNLCGVLKFHLEQEGATISRLELTANNGALCGEYTFEGAIDAPTIAPVSGGTHNKVSLACSTPQNIGGSGHDFFVYLPVSPAEGYDLTLKMYQPDGTICTKSASGIVVERNTIYKVNIGGSYAFEQPDGRLHGLFSIGDGNQVYFSKGNLQWRSNGTHAVNGGGTAAGTWRFAEHQYDRIGYNNTRISATTTSWVDLFGWGTSGYHDSSDPNNTQYNPYCTSVNDVSFPYNRYGFGPSTNMPSPNLTGTSANYDWGVYNAISNGGDTPGQWRTLTRTEWIYLISDRTDAANKYAVGSIDKGDGNYVEGLIVLPDDWTLPSGCTFNPGVDRDLPLFHGFDHNIYTLSQWSQMEAAGALFLPSGGSRWSGSVPNVHNGYYWASTYYDQMYAQSLNFDDYNVNTYGLGSRNDGYSIRLVWVPQF